MVLRILGRIKMQNTYFTFNALQGQRSSGFRNTTYALAEIIDNSFDAKANICKIIFIEKRDQYQKKFIDEILIDDRKNILRSISIVKKII